MISHDNYTWLCLTAKVLLETSDDMRILSYLPLSHVAAQFCDLMLPLSGGAHLYFTDDQALKGSLIDYLTEIRPTLFMSVPRVFEKMEEKIRATLEEKPTIMKWAMDAGRAGTHS